MWWRTCSAESEVEVWRRERVLRWEERGWWERWLRWCSALAPACLLRRELTCGEGECSSVVEPEEEVSRLHWEVAGVVSESDDVE
jgi:hypothetical protein